MANHMTAEQLLPCPFCGSAAIERWHRAGDDGYFEVCCVSTACTTFRHGIDESSVRAEWNKRHDAARLSGMAAVPEGWKVVPIAASPEMEAAAYLVAEHRPNDFDGIWEVMCDAAPEPPHV